MRLPSVRAHVGIVTCVVLAATVLGTPFAEAPSPSTEADPAIRLSGSTPPVPPAPSPTAPPTNLDPPPRRVSLVMGGDLLWHDTVWQSAARDARD